MVFEVICGVCGFLLYSGFELKSPREVLRLNGGKCRKCGAKLTLKDLTVEVLKAPFQ